MTRRGQSDSDSEPSMQSLQTFQWLDEKGADDPASDDLDVSKAHILCRISSSFDQLELTSLEF